VSETKILDLDAAFDRDTVKLGGKEYEFRTQGEFSILEWHQVMRMELQAKQLAKAAPGSADAAKKLAQKQRDFASQLIVGGLPADVPDWACSRIIEFWIERISVADSDGDGDAASPPKPRTTAASSRGSKRSTAATRKAGSGSRAGR
jgi:hypothetical protein